MKKLLLIPWLIAAQPALSQLIPVKLFENMHMRSIGPAVMSGRVTAIDVNDKNESVIYAGTASGGLWRSENAGVSWEPLFDKQPVQSIGAIAIDPSNSDVIWAGTGEGNPRNSQTSGKGIFKSLDNGRTWKTLGLENTKTIHRVIVDPKNSNTVYVGAHGSAWGTGPDRGVYRTSNGGESWEKILFVNDSVGCADLVMDPQNSQKLFAAMWQYGRKPWTFNSGGKGSALHITVDGGKTWTQLTDKNGLPEGNLGRIGLAISGSNPKIVYALIEAKKTGLYKSTDGGWNWQLVTTEAVDDRPFYYHELYVDPSNENHLIYLHSIVSESIDGGKTWKTILPYWGVHPDHHAFWWSPSNSDYMIEGNDGGLNISRDGGRSWQFANNLPLGQFYHINYDMDIPYHVYGGMQDNGSWKGPGYVWHHDGILGSDWQEIAFGDGFDVVPHPKDSRYNYAMSQGGYLSYIDTETGEERFIRPVHPDGEKLRFNWNAGIAQDPFSDCGLYYGSQFVHYSSDCGTSWNIISPDLTTNDSTKLKQAESGGLTIDATSAENHCTVLCISPSTLNKKIIWVGTDDGNLQLTTDGGANWKNIAPLIPTFPKGAWVPQIVPSTYQEGSAFVVVNNYRQNDWKPYLFFTNDFGKTWKNLAVEKQIEGHCLSVVQDPLEPNLIFLGTEHGLYLSIDAGTNWTKWTSNYPEGVATQDLKIHPREYDLIIGTFGRAAYILDDIRPLRALAKNGLTMLDKKLVAFETPTAYQANYIRPRGERFPADSYFAGENKSGGATLTYYFKVDEEKKQDEKNKDSKESEKLKAKSGKTSTTTPVIKTEPAKADTTKKEEKPKDKKVKISIHDKSGDTVRWFTHEPDTGINIVSWWFDTKGVQFPTRRERKLDDDPPGGGMQVEPGQYKVVYKFNEFKDSTTITVAYDPRIQFEKNTYDRQRALSKRYSECIQLADKGFEQLKQTKKSIELLKSAWVNVPDSIKKSVISESDSLMKKIGELEKFYMEPEGTTGIRDDSDFLTSKIWQAGAYINTGTTAPGNNSETAISFLEKETRKVADKINVFFEVDWRAWQEKATKIPYTLFKDVEKL